MQSKHRPLMFDNIKDPTGGSFSEPVYNTCQHIFKLLTSLFYYLMKNDKAIFIVKPKDDNSVEVIYSIFDTRKKAEQFLDRFKTFSNHLEILPNVLNPGYYTNPDLDPYYISLSKIAALPLDIAICDSPKLAEQAKVDSYNLSFHGQLDEQHGIFVLLCFAEDPEDAVRKAISKRDEIILNGFWESEWVKHNQRSS